MFGEEKALSRAILLGVVVAAGVGFGVTNLDPLGKASAAPPVTAVGAEERLAYEQNTIDIVQRYSPSVVAINVTVEGQRINPLENIPPELRRFFRQFGQNTPFSRPQRVIERAAGSGFVVNEQGQIVTNYHILAQALQSGSTELKPKATITVSFMGQDEDLPVKVVGADQSYDLALLQLERLQDRPANAIPIPLADSDKIKAGEKAIAIGNPFTLESTVTEGIVSAINRRQAAQISGVPIDFIQTDAAINPGNSGGPLLNSRGQVIGVNDEILAPHGTFVGVGLAIPSNLVQARLGELQHGGLVKKAQIGIQIMSMADYPEKVRKFLNLPSKGVMVVAVVEGGPAEKADIEPAQYAVTGEGRQWPVGGDVIVEVNGKALESAEALQNLVYSKHAGDTLELTLLNDQEKRTARVELAVLKE